MWTRKLPSEIAAQDRRARFGPIPAIFWALLVGAATFIVEVGCGWIEAAPPVPVSQALPRVPFVVVVVFFAIYVAQLVFGGWWLRADQARFCSRCRTVQPKRSGTHCTCGEQLELLRNWKWIPDEVTTS